MIRFFKAILKLLKSKSFIGSILFAFALWAYISLKVEYTTMVKIPIKLILPENLAVDSSGSQSITVEVSGTGWKLFNLLYLNQSASCRIDLSDEMPTDNKIEILRNELLKSVQLSGNLKAVNVIPEKITIKTGQISELRVPVKSALKLYPDEYFTIVGSPRFTPDSITVRGNDRSVHHISFWQTKQTEFDHLTRPFSTIVNLSDSLKNLIVLSENIVKMDLDIQQKASLTIPDVEVKVRGGTIFQDERILPERVTVMISSGIDRITDLQIENIRAFIDYSDILADSTGVLIPKIIVPDNIKVLKIEPPYLFHIKRIRATEISL